MTPTPMMDRKEIAQVMGDKVTVRQVRRNERKWGLDRARVKIKTRMVLYRRSAVLVILKDLGVME
jgi:hypothetical protein